jgi:hypothetical protein
MDPAAKAIPPIIKNTTYIRLRTLFRSSESESTVIGAEESCSDFKENLQ